MARKQHMEDFSKFRYAEMGGLDGIHEDMMKLGFSVHPCSTYVRIYYKGKYVATGKVVESRGKYVPMVFAFDSNVWPILDHADCVLYAGSMLWEKYPDYSRYNNRIVHPKGRIFSLKPIDAVTDEEITEWKEIYAEAGIEEIETNQS